MAPTLNFKAQFVELIASGKKRQTIRRRRVDGRANAVAGMPVKLYTGMRTADCKLIGEAMCQGVDAVDMRFGPARGYRIGGDRCAWESAAFKLDMFAHRDGFADWAELEAWFIATYEAQEFSGIIVQWWPTWIYVRAAG